MHVLINHFLGVLEVNMEPEWLGVVFAVRVEIAVSSKAVIEIMSKSGPKVSHLFLGAVVHGGVSMSGDNWIKWA